MNFHRFVASVLVVFLVLNLTFIWFNFVPTVKANPTWLSGWGKRVKIEIDCGDIDSDLSSFPVLIHLSETCGIGDAGNTTCVFTEVTTNSKKIAVTVGEDTETYVEIEKWSYDAGDESASEAWLWANVMATAASNQTLYLYYDNSHADNTEYVGVTNDAVTENVWDSDFIVVLHMRDGSDSSHIYDSTTNDWDGTKQGTESVEVTGKKYIS